jgi:hypothetical protein
MITTDLPAATQLLSPRDRLDNCGTAVAGG